jgi:hypothetical protein
MVKRKRRQLMDLIGIGVQNVLYGVQAMAQRIILVMMASNQQTNQKLIPLKWDSMRLGVIRSPTLLSLRGSVGEVQSCATDETEQATKWF